MDKTNIWKKCKRKSGKYINSNNKTISKERKTDFIVQMMKCSCFLYLIGSLIEMENMNIEEWTGSRFFRNMNEYG